MMQLFGWDLTMHKMLMDHAIGKHLCKEPQVVRYPDVVHEAFDMEARPFVMTGLSRCACFARPQPVIHEGILCGPQLIRPQPSAAGFSAGWALHWLSSKINGYHWIFTSCSPSSHGNPQTAWENKSTSGAILFYVLKENHVQSKFKQNSAYVDVCKLISSQILT